MPENSLHSRAWPWFVGAALVYGGTVIGAWWPRTGPPEVNLIPFQPHVHALRRGAALMDTGSAIAGLVACSIRRLLGPSNVAWRAAARG
jgi:hypothetical protein